MTRKDAKQKGLLTYSGGKICLKCNGSERYVSSYGCVPCSTTANDKEYIKNYGKTPKAKLRAREYRIKSHYGMTSISYNNMRENQKFSCAICLTHETQVYKSRLFIDHCHTTKKVRGLLCHHCNIGIGALKDSPELLMKAKGYLEQDSTNI